MAVVHVIGPISGLISARLFPDSCPPLGQMRMEREILAKQRNCNK